MAGRTNKARGALSRPVNAAFEAQTRELVLAALDSKNPNRDKQLKALEKGGISDSIITAVLRSRPLLDGTIMRLFAILDKSHKVSLAQMTPDVPIETPVAAVSNRNGKKAPAARGAAAIAVTHEDEDEEDKEQDEEDEEDDEEDEDEGDGEGLGVAARRS
jgi:hypothetical protein